MDIEKEVAYPADWASKLTIDIGGIKWTRLSRQKIIGFLTRAGNNCDYLMLTFLAFSPEYTSQGVR